MKRLQLLVLILMVTAGCGLAAPVWSAPASSPPGLTMEAEAAFDGYFKYGEWLPVWVQLENSGPDLQAELRVRTTGAWGVTTFAAPAPLPTGSRKRIPVYVLPNNFSQELEVQLVAGNDLLMVQKVSVTPRPNDSYFVGLVAPERGALALILSASLPGRERPKELIDLPLAELPGRPEGLRSFDCLIINDVDTSSLTPEQGAALEAWVRQGGRLVIGGGAGATHTAAGLPESLLPLVPRSVAEVKVLPGLADFANSKAIRVPGPFVVATGEPREGRTLAVQDGLPLVRERALGNGYVDFVALDLAISPFDAWTGTVAFWEKLLSPGAAYPEWLPPDISPRQIRSEEMAYALSSLPALDLPSVQGLAALLALYIVLVGPVNYFVLRWRKRLHWAWATIPLITLIFSGGAFGLGYALRGTDLILNKIAIIELQPDGTAGVTSYLGLFSPARRSYEIEVTGSSLLSPLTPEHLWRPGGAAGEMIFLQSNPSRVRGLAVNQWSMQTFMTEGMWADFGRIVGDLRIEGDGLTGTVRNETAHTLTDVVLILGNHFIRLGDLPPGEEAVVMMDSLDLVGQRFELPISWRLFQDQLNQPGPGGPPREAELKQRVVASVLERYRKFGPGTITHLGSSSGPLRELVLLGWLDEAPPDVRVAGRSPVQQTMALLYTPLSYHLAKEGPIRLPPGLISGALVEMPLEGGLCGPDATSVYINRGEAVVEFRVPDEVRDVQVDALKLVIGSEGGWWQPPATALYDWEAKAWAELDSPVMGVNVLSDPTGLVSDDGRVRVRLSHHGGQGGGCLHLELGLEGTR